MEIINITIMVGSILSLLLSIIAFFIKQFHTDFKLAEQHISEIKADTQLIKAEQRSGQDLLNQRVGFLEKRVGLNEQQLLKVQEYQLPDKRKPGKSL